MIQKTITIFILSLFLFTSCAKINSNYTPKDSRLLMSTYKNGSVVYRRDGQEFKARKYNRGLEEAVAGNSAAEAYAKEGVSDSQSATRLMIAALSMVVTGVALAIVGASQRSTAMSGVGLVTIGAGYIPALLSGIPASHAMGLFQDAINKYNDDIMIQTDKK